MVATKTSAQLSFVEQASRRVDRGEAAQNPTPLDPNKTGVVFVHGIGSQVPGETLLQWSAPIIEVLTSYRVQRGLVPADPVVRAEINFDEGQPAIELRIPPRAGSNDERTWVLTEAWWASRVQPPSLGTMTSWLGPRGAAGRIVDGILANPAGSGQLTGGAIAAARILLVPFVTVLAAVVLTVFAVFRAVSSLIPIDAVRDSAVLKSFDGFLTGWFGDVRVLLYDPAQSANIRAGVARSIRGLRESGCTHIVVVAHSGGAIVSFLTLTDEHLQGLHVDKLITFGEAWNLALQLSPRSDPPDGSGLADRLRANIAVRRSNLRWRDFWATNDPAPAGALRLREMGVAPDHIRFRSGRVWNRRSLVDDHGTYWTNQDEFVIPVIQELDVPDGWAEDSMFYRQVAAAAGGVVPAPNPGGGPVAASGKAGAVAVAGGPPAWPRPDDLEQGPRAERHRQRVAALALWRQMAIAIPVVLITIALGLRPDRLIEIGREGARLIGMIPGVSHLNGLIDWFNGLEAARIPITIGPVSFDLIWTMQFIGVAVLQAVVIISIVQLVSAPVRAFWAWPKKRPARIAAAVIEGLLIGLLGLAGLAVVLGSHAELLGTRGAWLPGVVLSIIVGLGAGLGSLAVAKYQSPGTTRLFGAVAAIFFVVSMVCAVVAIFGPANLPDAEVGYVVIWAASMILYGLGKARWHHWDRFEQQIGRRLESPGSVDRWPAYAGAGGVVIVLFAGALALLFRPDELPTIGGWPVAAVVVAIGALLVAISYGGGTKAAAGTRDLNMAPGPVESPGW